MKTFWNYFLFLFIALLFPALASAEDIAKYATIAPGGGNLSIAKTYTDWSKKWQTVIQAGDPNQIAFFSKIDNLMKIIKFSPDGSFTIQNTYTFPFFKQYDQVVRGNFGGTARNDLFFYDRTYGTVDVYEIAANGDVTILLSQPLGQKWDILATGRWSSNSSPTTDPSGTVYFRTDLMTYNKTEGKSTFWKYSNGVLGAAKNFTGWQKSWDQILAGNFDGNTTTDLLFYNQDGGNAKFYNFSESYGMTLIQEVTDWPMTENMIIVPGRFGGGSETDLFLYDQNRHIGTFMVDNGGSLVKGAEYPNLQDKWVQITAVDQPGSSTSDLIFYSNRYTITIKAVSLSDDDGGNPASVTKDQVNIWLDTARKAYKPAGIDFEYDDTIFSLKNSTINNYDCDGELDSTKMLADLLAFGISIDGVVVFFRNPTKSGVSKGRGCGSIDHKYVIMPAFNNTGTTYYKRDGTTYVDSSGNPLPSNYKLFAHELGHFFSLQHTYFSNASPASLAAMDVDTSSGVRDTPPDPSGISIDANNNGKEDTGEGFWDFFGYNRCDDSVAGEVPIMASDGNTYNINPERHNTMNNGCNCDLLYRFSPDQIRKIRGVLFNQRLYLIQ
jgi:hypothetical protein